jgi:hypothetical protein
MIQQGIADLTRFSSPVTAEMLVRAVREALLADLTCHDQSLTEHIALLRSQGKLEAVLRNMPDFG